MNNMITSKISYSMHKRIVTTVLIILISSVLMPVRSQQHDEKVTVIAPYQPTISDAFKINHQPVISDTVFTVEPLKYEFITSRYPTSFTPDPIKAAKVGKPTLPKLYKFLVKAGFGNYTMPYGEFFVSNTYSKSFTVGGHLKHLSSSGKIKNYSYPGNSENVAEFFGKKYLKNHVIGGNLGYNRNVVHYYGFKPDDFSVQPLDKDLTKQRFNLISANIFFNSTYHPDSLKLNHSITLGYYYLNDYFKLAENSISLKADINKDLHLFKITSSQVIGLEAVVNYCFDQDTLASHNAGLISLKPYLKTTFKKFNFSLGVDISAEADTNASLHFYPIADVQFNIVRNILIVFAGIKGGLTQNTYRSFTDDNPFINSHIPLSYTSIPYDIYGGIKSNISNTLNFRAYVSYSRIKDMPMYVNDTTLVFRNKFNIIYDRANLLKVSGELAWQKDEKFRLLAGGNFYNYKMVSEQKAWQKPIFDAYIDFQYNIRDKFIISAGITGRSNMYAKIWENGNEVSKSINGYADLSLGFEYRYSKILSAFINIDNVTTLRQYRYYNYPNYGFNLMGGLTYAF